MQVAHQEVLGSAFIPLMFPIVAPRCGKSQDVSHWSGTWLRFCDPFILSKKLQSEHFLQLLYDTNISF